MKKLIRPFLIAGLVLTSCNNNEPKSETIDNKQEQVNPTQEFARLNEFLRKFDEASQSFKASTNKRIKVTGKQGTIVHINPTDLETEDGQPLGKDVEIELKELSNQQQLLRANAQTISDGNLLISGGAYYLNLISDGKKVKLKTGKTYSVEFPQLANEQMMLYYGQRDSANKMNWKPANQKFESLKTKNYDLKGKEYEAIIVADGMRRGDTARIPMKQRDKEEIKKMEYEAKVAVKVYNPIQLDRFGWINCDKLFKNAGSTSVQYDISNKVEDVNYANVYLISKDTKSVLQSTYFSYGNKIERDNFNNIPIGMTVRFLAVCYQHQKVFATLTDSLKVTDKLTVKLLLQEMDEPDFDKAIKSIE